MIPFSQPARPTAGTSPGGDNPTRRRPAHLLDRDFVSANGLLVSALLDGLTAISRAAMSAYGLPKAPPASNSNVSFPLHAEGNAR